MGVKEKIQFLGQNPLSLVTFVRACIALSRSRSLKRSCWLLQCDFKGHFPYLKPYYDTLKDDKSVDVYFSAGSRENETLPVDFLLAQGIPGKRIIAPADYVSLLDFDVYMSPTEWGNIFPKNPHCIKVQLFHTLADKGIEYSKELLNFNAVFMNGPVHHHFMDKYVFSEYPESKEACKTFEVGYAKVDDLFDETYSRETVLSRLGVQIEEDRKIVLYAPNWESSSALHRYGEKVFSALQKSGHFVLVKLHYMSLLSPSNFYATGGVDWSQLLEKYGQNENIHIVDDVNINPYLYLADAMVTDYGGASLEFMAMDKPIVYLDCPDFFKERGEHVFENEARNTGHLIDNIDDLVPALHQALSVDPFKGKRREVSAELLYNPGHAAQVGIDTIHRLLGE